MHGIKSSVIGNVTADPELRQVNGQTVANFDLAVNHGYKDRSTDSWVESGTTFVRVACWREIAEHVGDTIRKGDEAVVIGDLQLEEFERKDGSKGAALRVNAQEVAVSLRWATADVRRKVRGSRAPFVAPPQVGAASGAASDDVLTGAGTPF